MLALWANARLEKLTILYQPRCSERSKFAKYLCTLYDKTLNSCKKKETLISWCKPFLQDTSCSNSSHFPLEQAHNVEAHNSCISSNECLLIIIRKKIQLQAIKNFTLHRHSSPFVGPMEEMFYSIHSPLRFNKKDMASSSKPITWTAAPHPNALFFFQSTAITSSSPHLKHIAVHAPNFDEKSRREKKKDGQDFHWNCMQIFQNVKLYRY